MKVYQILILLIFASCAVSSRTRVSRVITPTTKIQIAYFWITTANGGEYFLNAINFIDTGDMWILYTKTAGDEPEFLDVFQIDRGDIWYLPFAGRSGLREMSTKDYIADLFVKAAQMDVKEIRKIGYYEF